MRKAIFGGTFDPIHNGHMHIAYEALENLYLDELIFMPSGNPPHKTDKDITDANLRYELVNAAIRNEKRFSISDYEINKKNLNYTYETLEFFKKLEPDTEWYFITGADCLMELNTWKNVDRILKVCTLVVFNRMGYSREAIYEGKREVERTYGHEIVFLETKYLEISSTELRNMIKMKKNARYLMPEGVYNTILQLGLYRQGGI